MLCLEPHSITALTTGCSKCLQTGRCGDNWLFSPSGPVLLLEQNGLGRSPLPWIYLACRGAPECPAGLGDDKQNKSDLPSPIDCFRAHKNAPWGNEAISFNFSCQKAPQCCCVPSYTPKSPLRPFPLTSFYFFPPWPYLGQGPASFTQLMDLAQPFPTLSH